MANVCDICNLEFATPVALGSHKRKHREVKAEVNSSEPVTIRLLIEQAPINSRQTSDVQPDPYKCPDCEGELSLVGDGIGNYQLRCEAISVGQRQKALCLINQGTTNAWFYYKYQRILIGYPLNKILYGFIDRFRLLSEDEVGCLGDNHHL